MCAFPGAMCDVALLFFLMTQLCHCWEEKKWNIVIASEEQDMWKINLYIISSLSIVLISTLTAPLLELCYTMCVAIYPRLNHVSV